MKENNIYVYIYLDPRKEGDFIYGEYKFKYEPFYVGKGSGKRCYDHIKKSSEYKNNRMKGNKIKKIIRETKREPIIIKYKCNLTSEEAFKLEKKLIINIGRTDRKKGPLTNLTDGGDGVSNVSEETIKKLKSWKRTKEYAEKISNTLKGRKLTQETIDKIKESKIRNGTTGKGKAVFEKKFVVITPKNKILYIKGLKRFCKENNLKYLAMRRIVDGVRNHYKGYKISKINTEEEIQKMMNVKVIRNTTGYRIISPENKEYVIENLKEFCKQHNLSRPNFCSAYKKHKKYRGWQCFPLHNM